MKGNSTMYGIINSGGRQSIGEINKETGEIIISDVPKITSMCHEHITDIQLMSDLLEYEMRKEPHDDMFKAVAEFIVKNFDVRMKRTTMRGNLTPHGRSDSTKKEAYRHG